jgi:ADP-ribosylglycohydrolase
MIINTREYRDKVLGCWLGKNIGGTLGAPFEWRRQVNAVDFYTQDLAGEPLPNDDLDIQLLWLVALEEQGVEIDAHVLAEYWVLYVTPHWAEYGTAKINMRSGLQPPLSGVWNNVFKDSCGAFIRSEIWACIAPGLPRVAARYAYEDAILDHGDGEGVYAEVFCAALESAAFVESDLNVLIEIGLSYIPQDCGVAQAARCAIASYRAGRPWLEARHEVLRQYRGGLRPDQVSEEDRERGFDTGQRGWDVPSNIGMLVIGLLYGEGDLDRSLCIAVNCGEDTDCTGATVGSIWGLIHGAQAIPARWIDPIGRSIKTACLNLGELGLYGGQLPADVDDLTRRTERIARQVLLRHGEPVVLSDGPTDLAGLQPAALDAGDWMISLYENLGCTVFRSAWFTVAVDYDDGPAIRNGVPKTVRLHIRNTYKIAANLNLRWYVPDGWRVNPATTGTLFAPHSFLSRESTTLEFQLVADEIAGFTQRLAVELSSDGRPTVMLVPVTLVNGNMIQALVPPAPWTEG